MRPLPSVGLLIVGVLAAIPSATALAAQDVPAQLALEIPPAHIAPLKAGGHRPLPAVRPISSKPTSAARVDPSVVDPSGVDPSGVDPSGVNPSGVDPSGVDPSAVHPPRRNAASGGARSASAHFDSARPVTTQIGATQIGTTPIGTTQIGTTQIATTRTVSTRALGSKSASPRPTSLDPAGQCEAAVTTAEASYQVPPRLLRAIALTETGRKDPTSGTFRPWPWSINAEGQGQFFASAQDAIAAVHDLQGRGVQSIDVGCMQVNLMFHPNAFASLEEAFDPRRNALYAARFLNALYVTNKDWLLAAGAYHSETPALAEPYRQQVAARWQAPNLRNSLPPVTQYRDFVAVTQVYGDFAGTRRVYGAFTTGNGFH